MGTVTVAPPADGRHPTITIYDRTYSCDAGQTIAVPDFDAMVMAANGWSIMPYAAVVGLQSAVAPDTTLILNPDTGDVYQTTGS